MAPVTLRETGVGQDYYYYSVDAITSWNISRYSSIHIYAVPHLKYLIGSIPR